MSSQEEKVWIEPELDEQGLLVYKMQLRPDAENAEVYLAKVPDRVIPVIFVPGIMGSNLCSTKKNKRNKFKKIWRLDGVLTLLPWAFRGAKTRRELLEPNSVQVDPRGRIIKNNKDKKYFASRRERGWGEVGRYNYGKFLHWLQGQLLEIWREPSAPGKSLRHQWKQGHEIYATDEPVITLDASEVSLSARYLLPLHVVGYNWLASNADSAARLGQKVDEIIKHYRSKGHKCEKVILLTHSMGGLVARHYSENMGGKEKILGILHAVIPARGAATTYQRMKMGMGLAGLNGFVTNQIIGKDAETMTAVMSQSPGALQLLPGTEYGTGWLKIKEQGATHCLPVSDPYAEIYTSKEHWWGLCDPELMNPNNQPVKPSELEKDWGTYFKYMKNLVEPFVEDLTGKYHSNTHAFYGTEQPTYEHVVWQQQNKQPVTFVGHCSQPAGDASVLSAKLDKDSPRKKSMRKVRLLLDADVENNNPENIHTYRLMPATHLGDGTVAEYSAQLKPGQYQTQLSASMMEHEPAYDDTRGREYTMAVIIKIIQSVNQTGLKYD